MNRFKLIWVIGISALMVVGLGYAGRSSLEARPQPLAQITTTPSVTPGAMTTTVGFAPVVLLMPTPTPTSTPTPTPTPTPEPGLPPDDEEVEALTGTLINQNRMNNGQAVYESDDRLVQAARRHVFDMADNGHVSHIGSDGTTAGQRITAEGYSWSFHGEILAYGFGGNTASAVNWWMNSSIHSGIILSTNLDDFGTSYANRPGSDWTHYWVVTFGRPSGRDAHLPGQWCEFAMETKEGGVAGIVWQVEECGQ